MTAHQHRYTCAMVCLARVEHVDDGRSCRQEPVTAQRQQSACAASVTSGELAGGTDNHPKRIPVRGSMQLGSVPCKDRGELSAPENSRRPSGAHASARTAVEWPAAIAPAEAEVAVQLVAAVPSKPGDDVKAVRAGGTAFAVSRAVLQRVITRPLPAFTINTRPVIVPIAR